jgi:hypothetical protein
MSANKACAIGSCCQLQRRRERDTMAAGWQQDMTRTQAMPVIARSASDEAIQLSASGTMDCFALLAMTD